MASWRQALSAMRRTFIAGDEFSALPGPGSDYWFQTGPGLATGAGVRVTPAVALKASAVFACVNKIAKIMSSMPVHLYKVDRERGKTADLTHELEELLGSQPNATDTAVDFWHFLIWNAILRRTAYAEIVVGAGGQVQALLPLHSGFVYPELIQGGSSRWRFRYTDPFTGVTRTFLPGELFRFPGLVPNGLFGLGIADCAAEAIAIGLAADQYAARVFSNNLNMGYILSHPAKMSEPAKKNFLEAYEGRAAGIANAHRPILLQEGIKVEKASQNAQEAQLLEARKWQLLEICRVLDMPPHMVGVEDGVKGSSAEEQSLNFVRFTLQPWARKIEQSIRRDLILPDDNGARTHIAEFKFDSLLRGNAQARAEYLSKGLGSGGSPAWLSVNDARRSEDLPPLPGAEYDKPAHGTNPISPTGEGAPSDGGQQNDAPPKKTPAKQPAGALVGKEIAALHRAELRFVGDMARWHAYAQAFYGGFVSDVMRHCDVAKDVAKRYCAARVGQCAAARSARAAIEHLENNGAAELRDALAA